MNNQHVFIFLIISISLFSLNACISHVWIEVIYQEYLYPNGSRPTFLLGVFDKNGVQIVKDSVSSPDFTNEINFTTDKSWHETEKHFRKLQFTLKESVIASNNSLSLNSNIVNEDKEPELISSESIKFDSSLPFELYEIGEYKKFSGYVTFALVTRLFTAICAPNFYTKYCSVFCHDFEHGNCNENDILLCKKGVKGPKCAQNDPCYAEGRPVCKNGGECVPSSERQEFTCKCTKEYLGKTCDIKNPCVETTDFCLNGGICVPELDTEGIIYNPICICPRNFSFGEHCETRNYCFTERYSTPTCNEDIKTCTQNADSKSYMCHCKAAD
ncbi:hypothetical protein Ciccas_013616, partial [Cichlidogyrus casuarinus]